MEHLPSMFREYCRTHIAAKAQKPLTSAQKEKLVAELRQSPLRNVLQAWTVLDFFDYKHLWAEGFDRYFGYSNESMTADRILEIVHPDDTQAVGQLYYLVLEGLLHMPIPVKNIGHFSLSYRIQTGQGQYVRIMETNNIIESDGPTNLPLVCLTQISRIEQAPQPGRVGYSFVIKDENKSVEVMQSYLSHYSHEVNIFTTNELRIASLLKQGFTSQEIAAQVALSKHTVDKYRKVLLEKTHTSNTPALLSYLGGLNLV